MLCSCHLEILKLSEPGALNFHFALGPTNYVAGAAWWLKSWGEVSVSDESKGNPVLWPSWIHGFLSPLRAAEDAGRVELLSESLWLTMAHGGEGWRGQLVQPSPGAGFSHPPLAQAHPASLWIFSATRKDLFHCCLIVTAPHSCAVFKALQSLLQGLSHWVVTNLLCDRHFLRKKNWGNDNFQISIPWCPHSAFPLPSISDWNLTSSRKPVSLLKEKEEHLNSLY